MTNNYPIYVVDDERSICDSLRGIFSDEGYEIVTCLDAKTLFEKAAQVPPALVLLDIWLPDVDGLEVFRELRNRYGNKVPPTLFLTESDGGSPWREPPFSLRPFLSSRQSVALSPLFKLPTSLPANRSACGGESSAIVCLLWNRLSPT